MKKIEERLRADAPAWREAVARGALGARGSKDMGAEAPMPGLRWGVRGLMAAGLAGVVLGGAVWVQVQRESRRELRVVVPAVVTLDELAVRTWEEPYRVEVERVTRDVRRAVEFVVGVLPGELVGAPQDNEPTEQSRRAEPPPTA